MGRRGELNVGQLVRERHERDCVLIGFTTHRGTVTAATDWDDPAEQKQVRPALPDSYEALLHEVEIPRFLLTLRGSDIAPALHEPRLERAIGVIYRPETERASHYFHARLADQFDAVIHLDETRALEPLERSATWILPEPPETYPTGI
jgi:erythromycin esterase-like protein